jgi:hypothetical protein
LIAVTYTMWWYPVVHHFPLWLVAGDCWETFFSANALIHGHIGSIYGRPDGLIAFPGIVVLLAPAVALCQALHLPIGIPFSAVSTPTAWLLLEPFDLLAGSLVLFSVDAVARRLGISKPRRAFLAAVAVVALWNPLVYQWHPEDAFAVALGLWGLVAAVDGRWRRAGWLMGVGIAFQPLLLLGLAVVLALLKRNQIVGVVVRSILPAAILVSGPLIANPRTTLRTLTNQPISTIRDHPTPWVYFAPKLAHEMVAAGPARSVTVIVAAVLSWFACRRTLHLEFCLWMLAICFAIRVFFEPVLVVYYTFPTFVVAVLVAARGTRFRFALTCGLSCFATWYIHAWRHELTSWTVLVVCIGVALVASWPIGSSAPVAFLNPPEQASDRRDEGASKAPLSGGLAPS